MRERMKNLTAALLLVTAFLTASMPARAEGPRKEPRMDWMVRILEWLGVPPPGLASIWETSSAYIDPNGQPKHDSGGEASSDSSANIDPDG